MKLTYYRVDRTGTDDDDGQLIFDTLADAKAEYSKTLTRNATRVELERVTVEGSAAAIVAHFTGDPDITTAEAARETTDTLRVCDRSMDGRITETVTRRVSS